MRKRSGQLKLVMMATTTMAIAGCGAEPQEEGHFYTSLGQCQRDEVFTKAQCEQAFAEGEARHEKTAPRYESNGLCEEQHGSNQCSPHKPEGSIRTDYYTPNVGGYFLAGMITSAVIDGIGDLARPAYRNRRGGYYTSSGYKLGPVTSGYKTKVSTKAVTKKVIRPKVQTRTSVASRGGFGSRSGGFSFGG
ncbi:DUF1190 domain-containing protein [Flexibacterium corallicola]|uniref:DUF1190 domain-containing protein n=1 Tax=Flexibacterium corallicola TaxID=3037259 RepID=UPI00286F9B61|nr:DUF1190 domain-containing protein [Pseudovibrio sp. M1P-2-3]